MKKIVLMIFLLATFVQTTSCSSYMNRLYKQIDDGLGNNNNNNYNKFDFLTNAGKKKRGGVESLDNVSNREVHTLRPPVKRNYSQNRNRYSVNDLVDQSNEGSLWSFRGQDNYLFSPNNRKKMGDIVTIEVQGKLKQEISLELQRTFPTPYKRGDKLKDKNKLAAANTALGGAADAAGAGAMRTGDDESKKYGAPADEKIYDQISAVVVDEINKEHLMIEGRKEILHQNRKRILQVKMIIARKDVSDDDVVLSSKLLESTVAVLR
ncbi:MAG: flagellar basal body L-ring protein FlgH [Oligoflexia bacterium]|nr:flagellar basal body L-ring protein FlgH [Oligoflexia bacterium]